MVCKPARGGASASTARPLSMVYKPSEIAPRLLGTNGRPFGVRGARAWTFTWENDLAGRRQRLRAPATAIARAITQHA